MSEFEKYLNRRISPKENFQDLLEFPRFIEIETVNACNARCPMCTINDWERNLPLMSDEVFKKISDEVIEHKNHLQRVSLYRDGEPLIDKKLASRINILKQGGVDNISIASNMSLMTKDKSIELYEAGLDLVICSIDSLDKETFEKIRVRLKFEEVIDNTIKMFEVRNKIRPSAKIWVRMIKQDLNDDEWNKYYEFWSKYAKPQDRVYFHNIFNWGGQLKDYKPHELSFEPNLPCVALWSLCVIFTNGDVPLCNVDFNNKYPSGNVMSSSIKEIWKSKIMNERRELHLNKRKSEISLCKNCNVWDEATGDEIISKDYAEQVSIRASTK